MSTTSHRRSQRRRSKPVSYRGRAPNDLRRSQKFMMAFDEMRHLRLSDDKIDKKQRVKIYKKHNLTGTEWGNCYCAFRKRFPDRVLGPRKEATTTSLETTTVAATTTQVAIVVTTAEAVAIRIIIEEVVGMAMGMLVLSRNASSRCGIVSVSATTPRPSRRLLIVCKVQRLFPIW